MLLKNTSNANIDFEVAKGVQVVIPANSTSEVADEHAKEVLRRYNFVIDGEAVTKDYGDMDATELRQAYIAKFGKRGSPRWKEEDYIAKLIAAPEYELSDFTVDGDGKLVSEYINGEPFIVIKNVRLPKKEAKLLFNKARMKALESENENIEGDIEVAKGIEEEIKKQKASK